MGGWQVTGAGEKDVDGTYHRCVTSDVPDDPLNQWFLRHPDYGVTALTKFPNCKWYYLKDDGRHLIYYQPEQEAWYLVDMKDIKRGLAYSKVYVIYKVCRLYCTKCYETFPKGTNSCLDLFCGHGELNAKATWSATFPPNE